MKKSKKVAAKKSAKPRQSEAKSPGKSQAWIAKHIDVTPARVSQFVKEGIFEANADGKLDPDACRVRYIRFLRDETRRSSQSESAKRVQDERALEIKQRREREAGRLFAAEDVEAVMSDVLGTLRSELTGVPAIRHASRIGGSDGQRRSPSLSQAKSFQLLRVRLSWQGRCWSSLIILFLLLDFIPLPPFSSLVHQSVHRNVVQEVGEYRGG